MCMLSERPKLKALEEGVLDVVYSRNLSQTICQTLRGIMRSS